MGTFRPGLAKQQLRLIERIIFQTLFPPLRSQEPLCFGFRRGPRCSFPQEPPLQPPKLLQPSPGSHSPPSSMHRARGAGSGLTKDNRDRSRDAQVTPSGSLLWRDLACRDPAALHCGCTWDRPIPCPQTGSEQHPCRNPQTVHYQGWDFNQSFQLGSHLPMKPPC